MNKLLTLYLEKYPEIKAAFEDIKRLLMARATRLPKLYLSLDKSCAIEDASVPRSSRTIRFITGDEINLDYPVFATFSELKKKDIKYLRLTVRYENDEDGLNLFYDEILPVWEARNMENINKSRGYLFVHCFGIKPTGEEVKYDKEWARELQADIDTGKFNGAEKFFRKQKREYPSERIYLKPNTKPKTKNGTPD